MTTIQKNRLVGTAWLAMLSIAGATVSAPGEDKAPATVTLKSNQSKIKGLLVVPLSSSNFAGKASQMHVTAVRGQIRGFPSEVSFNQDVGKSMGTALAEVRRFLTLRHGGWPEDYDIKVAFEDKWSPKDGPSAAAACALLIDSLISGKKLNQRFAVTGDLNADGAVRPVGGVADKVEGAASRDCNVVAIPEKNRRRISDLLINKGIAPLLKIQIFSVKDFEQAHALARLEREPKLQEAIDSFGKIQRAVKGKRNALALLRHPKIKDRLRVISSEYPNHLSARLLYLRAAGKTPRKLSLYGSFTEIDKAADALVLAAKAQDDVPSVGRNELAEAVSDLRSLRVKLDKRTLRYADALTDYGTLVREMIDNPPNSDTEKFKLSQKLDSAGERIDAEIRRLRANKEVMEELVR